MLRPVSPRRSGWLPRGGLVLFTFAMALLAFQAGVGTSAREGLPTADLLTHVYYSLGLLVLGGLDLGIPRGGPVEARAVACRALQRAIVVDMAAERQVRLLRAQVPGFERCGLVTVQGDLDDPRTWASAEEATRGLGVTPVYVIGTDDDQLNLRTAIALRSLHPEARIFVRCVYESAFTTQLTARLAVEVLAVEAMLRQALREQLPAWIGRGA